MCSDIPRYQTLHSKFRDFNMNSNTSHQTLLRAPLSLLSYKRASSERYDFHQGLSQTHSHTYKATVALVVTSTILWRKSQSPHLCRWAASKTSSCTSSLPRPQSGRLQNVNSQSSSPQKIGGALAKANSAFSEGVFRVPLNSGSIKVVSRHLTICTHSSKRMHLNIFHAHCLICILTPRNQRVLCKPVPAHTSHL